MTLKNKLHWYFDLNTKLFIHGNGSETIVCEMATILSRGDELTDILYPVYVYDGQYIQESQKAYKDTCDIYNILFFDAWFQCALKLSHHPIPTSI